MRTMKHWALAAMAATALALAGCGGGGSSSTVTTPTQKTSPTPAELATAADMALTEAKTLVDGLTDESTDAQVKAAKDKVKAAETAVGAASEADNHAALSKRLGDLEGSLREKETSRTAALADDQKVKDAMTAADAIKLHAGLEHGLGNTDNARGGASDADGVITVTNGSTTQALAEDKKTMVDANHGWEGKRHTAEPTGDAGTYEAMVYSNVGEPEEGDPFNEEYTLSAADATNPGEAAIDTSGTGVAGRVASSSFDQDAGTKLFTLPTNTIRVMVPGSYHGVSGTYYCTPTDANTKCSSTIATSGFTLGGGTWTFKPTTATDKVTGTPDAIYASYGWWLHKSEDGKTYTASAFATARGTVPAAAGIAALRGTATYMGGAAGKYALSSSTGGTNDAGHFTARATLEADFNADMISGTIDQFMGADGMSRNWSVELMKQGVSDAGVILGDDGAGTAGTDEKMTKWTIDGTAGAAAGQWSGTLYDNDTDGVPKVGTGTFHSTHGTGNRMVGAFGVNKQ